MTVLPAQPTISEKQSSSTISSIATMIEGMESVLDNLIIFKSTTFEVPAQQALIVYDLMEKLNSMRFFDKNWDSYGAEPPSEVAISSAIDFLRSNVFYSLPFYFTAPGVNGEVMIELKDRNHAAELFFNPDGSNELFLFENDECKLEDTIEKGFEELIEFFND